MNNSPRTKFAQSLFQGSERPCRGTCRGVRLTSSGCSMSHRTQSVSQSISRPTGDQAALTRWAEPTRTTGTYYVNPQEKLHILCLGATGRARRRPRVPTHPPEHVCCTCTSGQASRTLCQPLQCPGRQEPKPGEWDFAPPPHHPQRASCPSRGLGKTSVSPGGLSVTFCYYCPTGLSLPGRRPACFIKPNPVWGQLL